MKGSNPLKIFQTDKMRAKAPAPKKAHLAEEVEIYFIVYFLNLFFPWLLVKAPIL